jgi:hypothetical protein
MVPYYGVIYSVIYYYVICNITVWCYNMLSLYYGAIYSIMYHGVVYYGVICYDVT